VFIKKFIIFYFIYFLSLSCFAQVLIPFSFWGKKTLWVPTDLSTDLLAWYDASDPTTIRTGAAGISQAADTDPVSEWRDKSGNGYHAQQSIAGRQPTYSAAGWTSGLPTISWDGVNNGLVITGLTWQNYSFAMITRHSIVSGIRAFITKRSAVSANFFWFIYNSTSGTFNWDQNGNRFNTGFAPTAATDYIYTLVRPLTGTSRNQYVNGTLNGSTATNTDDNNTQTIILGNDYSAANRGASSIISELVIVNNDVSDGIRESMEGYLAWKWNIVTSLPANHRYKTIPP
jgi:hypothetical protein